MSRVEQVRAAIAAALPTGTTFGDSGVLLRRGEWSTWVNRGKAGSAVQVPERPGLWLGPSIVYVECATVAVALFSLVDLIGTRYWTDSKGAYEGAEGVRLGSWVGPGVATYLEALAAPVGVTS